MRILSTCRDPASAASLAPILSRLQSIKGIKLRVLAQDPAFRILLKNKRLKEVDIIQVEDTHFQNIINVAHSALESFNPSAVFCGVSGPDAGIDEALLKVAKTASIRRFTFQDYWGYLNPESIDYNDVIMVIDDHAKSLTASQTGSQIEVVGCPKYDGYARLDMSKLKKSFLKKNKITGTSYVLGFAGQPLAGLEGYLKTIQSLSSAVSNLDMDIQCVYRPHPKEDLDTQKKILNTFNKFSCAIQLQNNNDPIEELFAGADLLASLFSTAGYDAQMLNKCSTSPVASTLYLMFENDISDFFCNKNMIAQIPFSEPPCAVTIRNAKNITSTLEHCLSPETKLFRHEQIHKTFQKHRSSVDSVVDLITHELNHSGRT